jgi:hypothetical protein
MDPATATSAPRVIIDANGKERLDRGSDVGNPKGLGRLGGVGARDGSVNTDLMKYEDGRPGGFDPHARIKDLDLDGIDAAFLYPSMGLFSGAVKEPKLAAAMCRAYNRWLADYCKPYPDRLFGVAMLPMQSVDLAIDEMRFARKELGMKGGFLRPNPYNNRMANHPDYDPFWAEAEDLDFSIGFHEAPRAGCRPSASIARGTRRWHIISHTMEMMLSRSPSSGVARASASRRSDRLPGVGAAAGSRRGSTGWTATSTMSGSTIPASRPARASFPAQLLDLVRAVEGALDVLADYIGPTRSWATDYPHADGSSGAPAMISRRRGSPSHQARNPGWRRDAVLRPHVGRERRGRSKIARGLRTSIWSI